MKKNQFFVLLLLATFLLSSCVDYSLKEPSEQIVGTNYVLKVSSAVITNDTIYGTTTNQILFFVVNTAANDALVNIQCDFGDGTIDGGTQVLHKYSANGIYKLKVTIVGTGFIINRIVKIVAPYVSLSGATIIQLSGNTVGDSASINLLCRKDKIFNYNSRGNYYLKGDMNSWKANILPADTSLLYNGIVYLQFNFKVKNNSWCNFGYYKQTTTGEQWSYDPTDQFWNSAKALYGFYVSNSIISANQLTTTVPGSCGDQSTSSLGPVIRLDYETNTSSSDSLIIYANRSYIGTDSTKMAIGYTVDSSNPVIKKARFLKNTNYIFIKTPITRFSTIHFKTYKDVSTLILGDITQSIFYSSTTKDCYLTIAGIVQKVASKTASNSWIGIITPNKQTIYMN